MNENEKCQLQFSDVTEQINVVIISLNNFLNKMSEDIIYLQKQINNINYRIEKIQIMLHDDGK